MDFVADTFSASRRLRILAINDELCRENLCLVGDISTSGVRVARELDTLVPLYGKPACAVSHKGTEFTSRAVLKGAARPESSGTTSIRESPSRMRSSIRSMGRCATSSEMGAVRQPG